MAQRKLREKYVAENETLCVQHAVQQNVCCVNVLCSQVRIDRQSDLQVPLRGVLVLRDKGLSLHQI